MGIDQRAFRDAMGCFATGVCLATSKAGDGSPVGLTVNSFTSVSLDPPLVLFCLDKAADCLDVFTTASGFAITVLAADQQELSVRFAGHPDRWAGVATEIWESGAPVVTGGLAAMDCARHAVHDAGDHVILVGRVLRLHSRPEGAPLLYFRGGYAGLAR